MFGVELMQPSRQNRETSLFAAWSVSNGIVRTSRKSRS